MDILTQKEKKLYAYPYFHISVILDGYDKLCSTAKKLSSLLFELQRDHLQQFELTWTILNKRMYQRYVYMEIQELIPECILKVSSNIPFHVQIVIWIVRDDFAVERSSGTGKIQYDGPSADSFR